LITIKIDCDKLLADCASMLESPQPVVQLRSDERRRNHSWTHIEQIAHQGALPLDDCHAGAALALNYECKARYFENRQLSSRPLPPPALTPPSAGTSGDRPDLPADDWTAPSTAKPVAAAAIGSVVGSLVRAGTDMSSNKVVRKREQNN
jgi:hypothetical protein